MKKIAVFISAILMVLMLGACGTNPTDVDYNGHTYDELKAEITEGATTLQGQNKDMVEFFLSSLEYLKENPTDETSVEEVDFYIDLTTKWLSAMEVSGEYVGIVEDSFVIDKAGNTLTTDLTLKFSEREVTFQYVYRYYDMKLTGVTIEPVYSLGEKMATAALNTVICMAIVFAVLILISLIITCFRIFPYIEKKKAEKKAKELAVTSASSAVEPVQETVEEYVDDTELVAVIAAAIAAYTGTSTSDFVVRSIRRR